MSATEGVVAFIWTPNDQLLEAQSRRPVLAEEVTFKVVYPTGDPTKDRIFKHGPGVRVIAKGDGFCVGWVRIYDKSHLISRIEGGLVLSGEIEEGNKSYWSNAGGTCISGRVSFVVGQEKEPKKEEIDGNPEEKKEEDIETE